MTKPGLLLIGTVPCISRHCKSAEAETGRPPGVRHVYVEQHGPQLPASHMDGNVNQDEGGEHGHSRVSMMTDHTLLLPSTEPNLSSFLSCKLLFTNSLGVWIEF